MHPILREISIELQQADIRQRYRFALACVEEIAGNLEDDDALEALRRLRKEVSAFDAQSPGALQALAEDLRQISQSHPGSRSIDGTRHAAVSATYALARAAEGNALDAAAYAAYSSVYGYGGYAVSDPEAFAEAHQRQLDTLRKVLSDPAAQRS